MIERCAIYIRVSTFEQSLHGHSLQAQKEFLENYAMSHSMKVVGIYADEGQTARKELKKRKAIRSLLKSVENNEIDVILFWKMDRWFRNVSDFYRVQDILDAHGVRWVSAAEPNINMDTRDGRLSLNLILSIGQNEVDTTSERIRFTVDNMIQNGRLVWGELNTPLGYTIREVDGHRRMVKDEETAPIVEEFFRYFQQTHNKCATQRHISEMFNINFTRSMLRTMLRSEFYIGKYRSNTNYCPAYLTVEEWEEIQKISNANIRQSPSGRIYLFSGLMRCPVCGQKLYGTGGSSIINRKTGEKRVYCYYRCNRAYIDRNCTYRHSYSQNLLEDYLLNNLSNEYEKFQMRCSKIRAAQKKQRKTRTSDQIRKEMDRLNLLYQKGRIEYGYYEEQYSKLESEMAKLNIIPIDPVKDYSELEKTLSGDFVGMYRELSPENKRNFWHQIIKEIHITEDNCVDYVDFL